MICRRFFLQKKLCISSLPHKKKKRLGFATFFSRCARLKPSLPLPLSLGFQLQLAGQKSKAKVRAPRSPIVLRTAACGLLRIKNYVFYQNDEKKISKNVTNNIFQTLFSLQKKAMENIIKIYQKKPQKKLKKNKSRPVAF